MANRKIGAPGIRYREHPTRKFRGKPDRYYFLRLSGHEEAFGWASEGWTLDLAKEKRLELKRNRRTGEGPTSLREAAEIARTVERQQREAEERFASRNRAVAVLWDRYVKEIIAVENKPRTAAEKARMWRRRIAPAIGDRPVNEITEEDCSAIVRSPMLMAGNQVVSGKGEAGNLYRVLHHLFHKALIWGLRSRELGNPLDGINEPRVPRRERLLTVGEIGVLCKILKDPGVVAREQPQVIATIHAALLTGARISELLNLRWEYIRRDEMELHLPDTKTGFSRRPISTDMLVLLDSVPRIPGVSFVFRSVKDPQKPLSYNTIAKAFSRIAAAAGLRDCSLHTLRHWVATMTANSEPNPHVGMAITGHKSHAAYLNYVHGDKERSRALVNQLAAFTRNLGSGEPHIVEMGKRRIR
jgi:integrase